MSEIQKGNSDILIVDDDEDLSCITMDFWPPTDPILFGRVYFQYLDYIP